MDELTLVRALRSEQDGPTSAAVTRGRAALFERIAIEVDPGRSATESRAPRRRRRVAGGLSALGAGALVAGLVLTDVVGLAGWRGSADAAAAAVLERAAVATIEFEDVDLRAGQYLYIESETVGISSSTGDDGRMIQYQARNVERLYVPADLDDDWVWIRPPSELMAVLTPGGEEVIEEQFASIREGRGVEPERLRSPGGEFYGKDADSQWGNYDSMPRDPYLLLNHIYLSTIGQGQSFDGQALVFIADTLRQGTAPADLRAALFRAAAMIPGVTVVDEQTTLDGELGIAVGRLESTSGLRQELIFSSASGRLIGERSLVVEDRDSSDLEPGDVWSWSVVRYWVRDGAPAGGTPNGALDVWGCVPGKQSGSWDCPQPEGE